MLFKYKGIDRRSGKRIKGTITAATLEEASQKLRAQEILYESLSPTKEISLDALAKRQMSHELLAAFSKELSSYLNSGMTILTAVKLMENQHKGEKRFSSFLGAVRTMIDEGKNLYQSLKAQKVYTLPEFYLQSLKVAGEGGKMVEVLTNMANFFTAQNKVRKQVKGAMIYPSVIFIVAIGMTAFLIAFVVPKITEIFEDTGKELPPLTRFVLSLSDFLTAHYVAILIALLGVILLFKLLYAKSLSFRYGIDRWLLRVPILGGLIQNHELGRFSYILSLMLESGVAYAPAVELSKATFSNEALKRLFSEAAKKVQEGNKLSNALHLQKKANILKRNFLQSLALGEESSEVASILKNISLLYAEENDDRLKLLLSLMEPFMMLFIGLIVGVIVAAMLLPIFTMTQGIKG